MEVELIPDALYKQSQPQIHAGYVPHLTSHVHDLGERLIAVRAVYIDMDFSLVSHPRCPYLNTTSRRRRGGTPRPCFNLWICLLCFFSKRKGVVGLERKLVTWIFSFVCCKGPSDMCNGGSTTVDDVHGVRSMEMHSMSILYITALFLFSLG